MWKRAGKSLNPMLHTSSKVICKMLSSLRSALIGFLLSGCDPLPTPDSKTPCGSRLMAIKGQLGVMGKATKWHLNLTVQPRADKSFWSYPSFNTVGRCRNRPHGWLLNAFACMHTQSLHLCLTLWDLMDCSPPGSSVHGIFLGRILEWVAMPSSKESSQPRDQTHISCISYIAGRFFTAKLLGKGLLKVTHIWQTTLPALHFKVCGMCLLPSFLWLIFENAFSHSCEGSEGSECPPFFFSFSHEDKLNHKYSSGLFKVWRL